MQGPRLPSHSIELPTIQLPKRPVSFQPSNDGSSIAPPPKSFANRALAKLKTHAAFVGPGVIASVAYIDPGNYATDLQAGSQFGYALLFIVFMAGLLALLFQILACRLGSVSGNDLAEHCRLAMHDRPKNKMLWRWGVLYPLYVIAECGIIFTDLAELLGSAIAINLMIPAIPLYACVLLTSFDVFLVLLLFSNYPAAIVTRSMRVFELMIGLLVLCVLGSLVALVVKVGPEWKEVFRGYVPSSQVIRGGGLYASVGIIGATAMPHSFFIGSKMATMKRLLPQQYGDDSSSELDKKEDLQVQSVAEDHVRPAEAPSSPQIHLHLPQPMTFDYELRSEEEGRKKKSGASGYGLAAVKPTLACVNAHLGHAVADITGSLLGFAILINSSILIVAAAVFYYGPGKSSSGTGVSDLFDAFDLIEKYVGKTFAYLFAIALLASGQSASLTVTLSGQIISEGFIQWRTTPWKRRLITRTIGIVPSVVIAATVGRDGLDVLLIGSQVALSIVLPFVIMPLVIFTTSHSIMSLPKDPSAPAPPPLVKTPSSERKTLKSTFQKLGHQLNPFRRRTGPANYVSFANGMLVIYVAWAIWGVISLCNIYALYDLGKGDS